MRLSRKAMEHPSVLINGGQRGLQVRLDPRDAASLLKVVIGPLVA